MLALRGIVRTFGRRRALDGVSLEVAAGEVVLLVGRNGAGKTTLLRIATGYLDPDAGEVAVDGASMLAARTAAQAKIGYLPEHAPAPGELTVQQYLAMRARLKRASVAEVIELAALGDVLGQRIATVSKGYRQRVGLADALLGAPRLLILDEPTSGLDPIQVRELRAHIAAAAAARAVLVSSHAVTELAPLATRIAVLRAGALVADEAPDALCARLGVESVEAAVVALLDGADGVDGAAGVAGAAEAS